VNGTVNDLVVSGTRPLHLSAGFILEEGFPVADLRATEAVWCLRDATHGGIATILNEVARAANVAVVLDERAIPVRPESGRPASFSVSIPFTSPAEGAWWPSSMRRRQIRPCWPCALIL